MLHLLTKRFFDISLLFKLKYAAISLMLWTVNKSCYNDSLCLHEYTKMIGFKKKRNSRKSRNNFCFSAESTFQESVSKQNFYACARAKKAMLLPHSAYIPSSVKTPLWKANLTQHLYTCILLFDVFNGYSTSIKEIR